MLRQLKSCVRKPPSAGPDRRADGARQPPHGDRVRVAPADAGEHRNGAGERERGAEALQHVGRRSAARTNWRSRRRATRPRTRPSPMPANTWPRTRRSEREHGERADDDREVVRGDRPRHGDDRDVERPVEIGQREHHDGRVGDCQRDRECDDRDEQRIVPPRNVGRDAHYRSSTGVAINVCVYPVSVLLST